MGLERQEVEEWTDIPAKFKEVMTRLLRVITDEHTDLLHPAIVHRTDNLHESRHQLFYPGNDLLPAANANMLPSDLPLCDNDTRLNCGRPLL